MPDRQVAFYARVSTESQARDNTIASQITALRERVAAMAGNSSPITPMSMRATAVSSLSAPRWSGCAMRRQREALGGFMSSRPTGWPAVTLTRRC